jgi:dTDP-4-dehydrorhamnose reductase
VKIAVLGAETMLGLAVVRQLRQRKHEPVVIDTGPLHEDWTSYIKLIDGLDCRFVVNTMHLDEFYSTGTVSAASRNLFRQIAQFCYDSHRVMLHASLSQVFPNTPDVRFDEASETDPGTALGEYLMTAEQRVLSMGEYGIVLRVCNLFGNEGALFKKMYRLIESGGLMRFRDDYQMAFSCAEDVARVIVAMAEQVQVGAPGRGLYHYCSGMMASPLEFAQALLGLMLQSMPAGEKPLKIQRARRDSFVVGASLSCAKIVRDFGIKQRPWRSALATDVKQLFSLRDY